MSEATKRLGESAVYNKLRDATQQIKNDAHADWQDIKNKLKK